MRRFEIRIHAIAANIDNTTNPSPNALARVAPDASLLESAISAAPTLDATNAIHPACRNRSPEDADSVIIDAGPYASTARKGATVTSHSVSRLRDGRLVGTMTAHYTVEATESLVHIRLEGTREH